MTIENEPIEEPVGRKEGRICSCPKCGKPLDVCERYSFDYLKCKCGAFYTRDRGSNDILNMTSYEVQKETGNLRWKIYRLYDLRTGTDLVARKTYNEWLAMYDFFEPVDARLVRNDLKQMERKSRGEVWLDRPPKRWRDKAGE